MARKEASMRKLILVLAVAGVVLAASAAAAETPAVSIELAHNRANEQQVKDQLGRLLKEYDLSRWIFTKKIRIEQGTRPHSHPVLTLNTRYATNDRLLLAGFVHEQIHWFLVGKGRDASKAIGEAAQRYPNAPESLSDGGAGNRSSTTLHLVVCQLEFESLRALLGADAARAVLEEQIKEGTSGLGYQWIYQKVLDDQNDLSALVRKHKLTLPGIP
jgi:hypothetical protein